LGLLKEGVLWRIFGAKRDEVTGGWRKFMMRSFMIVLFIEYFLDGRIKDRTTQ
jgi:hypothetical protein